LFLISLTAGGGSFFIYALSTAWERGTLEEYSRVLFPNFSLPVGLFNISHAIHRPILIFPSLPRKIIGLVTTTSPPNDRGILD